MILQRNNIYNIFGSGIERFLKLPVQFLSTSFVLREIGVIATGELAMVVATYLLITSISANGLSQILIKKKAKDRESKSNAVINYFFVQHIYALLGSTIFIIYIGFSSIYIYFIIPIFLSQLNLLKAKAEAKRNLIQITPYEAYVAIIFAVIKFLCLKIMTLQLVVALLVLEYSIYHLLPLRFLSKKDLSIRHLNKKIILRLLKKSIWFVGMAISISIQMRIDQIMIYEMLSSEANGNYSATVRITESITSLFLVFVPTLNALVQRYSLKNSLGMLKSTLRIGLLGFFCMASLLMYFGSEIFFFLYGETFTYNKIHMILLLGAIIFVFTGTVSSSLYTKNNLEKYLFYNMLIAVIVNILLNIILIPTIGIAGACISTFIAYAITGFLADFIWKKTIFIGHLKLSALRAA